MGSRVMRPAHTNISATDPVSNIIDPDPILENRIRIRHSKNTDQEKMLEQDCGLKG